MNKGLPYAVFLGAVALSGCCDREADRRVLDQQGGFYCPSSNEVVYEAWSECGLMKVCVSRGSRIKQGSQFAAQGGKLRSKSMYSQGERVGGWTGFDNDGKELPEDGGYKPPSL